MTNKEQEYANTLSIIIEALLYTTNPAFAYSIERDEFEVFNVIENLKKDNPEIFDFINLSKLELLYDIESSQNKFVNDIIQLLGDKLSIVNLIDN